MNKNNHQNNSDQESAKEDLFQTIEFTDEDKAKLREPNSQPIDADYFAKEMMEANSQKEEVETTTETNKKISNRFKLKRAQIPSFKKIIKPTYEDEYNLEELDDLADYNQFNKEKDDENSLSFFEKIKNKFQGNTEANPVDDEVEPDLLQSNSINQNVENTSQVSTEFEQNVSVEQVDQEEVGPAETEEESELSSLFDQSKASLRNFWSKVTRLYSGEDDYDLINLDDSKGETADSIEKVVSNKDLNSDNSSNHEEVEIDISSMSSFSQEASEETSEDTKEDFSNDESQTVNLDESNETDQASLTKHIEVEKTEEKLSDEELEVLSDKISKQARQLLEETQELEQPIVQDSHVQEVLVGTNLATSINQVHQEDDTIKDSNSILGGATWLTVGSILSRVIGALYVIPWSSMFGESYIDVNSLYSIGYRPYTLFLAIATAGFPSAIAKQMSYYHSQKEYRVANKLFKNSMYIMIATGVVAALLLYLFAPGIASISSTDETAAAVVVIRSLTPALLILPAMSLLRGYFQGFNDMKPTAISQIIEQISRVAYLLIATYAVLMIMRGEVNTAIVHSTFAAFIGALASLLYLIFLYIKSLPIVNQLVETSRDEIDIDVKESFQIMVKDSIPFILLGSGIIIAQFVDQITFSQIMQKTSSLLFNEISQLYGTLSVDVDKLVMIIVSIAVALASSLVPIITSYFARKNYQGTSELIVSVMILFSFVMIPAALGMAAVSDNIYYFFFANGLDAGPNLLITGSIGSIVLGAFTVISTILQSMNFRRVAVRFLVVGLIAKVLLQYPLVALFNAHGALIATMIGLGISTILMWIKLHRELEIDYGRLNSSLIKIVSGSILMAISASVWNQTLNLAFGPGGRGLIFGKIIIVVLMAVIVYGSAMALTGMLSVILGDRYQEIQNRMRLF